MQRNPQPESGRFNPRIAASLMLGLAGTSLAMLSFAAPQGQPPVVGTISAGASVVASEFSGDLRDLPQAITDAERKSFIRPLELEGPVVGRKQVLPGARATAPSPARASATAPMPNPIITFDAMSYDSNGAGHPPDTVGDVGPNHFVQAVNTSVGIYDKASGAALATVSFNSLWNGANTGTSCDTNHNGDPTVIYVPQYDRFIVADFSWSNIQSGPYYECVAVSKTSDPVSGGWWFYAIRADDNTHPWLPDYPKMGIWPDGLYMTANMFQCLDSQCNNSNSKGVRAFAFNITDLVNGAILRSVIVDNSNEFSMLPSNYRGTPPPVGTPNYMVAESTTAYAWDVYKFHPDYSVPANSTFAGPINVSQMSYVPAADPVPEPSGNNTDTLADRAMMQNQYRNIGGDESIWVNHTTGPAGPYGPPTTPTGIQWAQIDVTGGNVNITPVQEQIFNNGLDGMNRFMGALAVDRVGNMAVGYTASSSSVAPDIRYAGRLSTDPVNSLPQTEVTMLPSVSRSVQFGSCGSSSCTRWGDYSGMTVDPVDDCTFWYTNMYVPVKGLNWVTRIGSFKFPTCSVGPTPTPTPGGTPTPTPTATPPSTGPAVMLSPPPGSTFTSSTVTFQWSAGSATAYSLIIGSSPGAGDIYVAGNLHGLSTTVNNIPTDGRNVYVALYSQVNNSWTSNSYTYKAFSASGTPTPTPVPSPTPTATPTPTPTPTPTATPTPSVTPTPTATATPTASPTPTPVPSPTPTATPMPTVDTPTFSPSGGTFRRRVTVEILCTTPGATVYYTTNGTTPTTSSPVYSSAITLTGRGKKTVKAIGSEPGYNDSAVATATFTIR
jgi:Chitobiase/beta-hexosaminidase C-terminal domain